MRESESYMRPFELQNEIEQFVIEQFAFLVDEKGFQLLPLKRLRASYSEIKFVGEKIGINIYIEFYSSIIMDKLFEVEKDALSPSPLVDLYKVLRDLLNVADQRIQQMAQLEHTKLPWSNQIYKDIIRLDAEIIRENIDSLCALPLDVIFTSSAHK